MAVYCWITPGGECLQSHIPKDTHMCSVPQVLNKYCLSSDLLDDSAKLLYLNRKLKELKAHVSTIAFLFLPAWKRALFSPCRPLLCPPSSTLNLVIFVKFGMGPGVFEFTKAIIAGC